MTGVKITRKAIKRDELAEGLGGLADIVQRHARSVAIAAGAVVILAGAVTGGVMFSRSRANEARAKLGAVYKALASPAADEGVAGAGYLTRQQKYEEIVRLAGVVIADHPSSEAAGWAAYFKAVGQKELGDLSGAAETLSKLSTGADEFLGASAKFLQAQVREAQGDAAGALEIYAALAGSAPARFPAEMALMGQARVLEAQGKTEEAREIYRRITQEFPDSPFSRDASERLSPTAG